MVGRREREGKGCWKKGSYTSIVSYLLCYVELSDTVHIIQLHNGVLNMDVGEMVKYTGANTGVKEIHRLWVLM